MSLNRFLRCQKPLLNFILHFPAFNLKVVFKVFFFFTNKCQNKHSSVSVFQGGAKSLLFENLDTIYNTHIWANTTKSILRFYDPVVERVKVPIIIKRLSTLLIYPITITIWLGIQLLLMKIVFWTKKRNCFWKPHIFLKYSSFSP